MRPSLLLLLLLTPSAALSLALGIIVAAEGMKEGETVAAQGSHFPAAFALLAEGASVDPTPNTGMGTRLKAGGCLQNGIPSAATKSTSTQGCPWEGW